MQFRNLSSQQEVTRQSTATYTFDSLELEIEIKNDDGSVERKTIVPWIEVRPGGEMNKGYFNAVLAHQSKNRRRLAKGKISTLMLQENRAEDARLYPLHILTGKWGGWLDDNTGQEVPFSPEAAHELLRQLPPEEFDEFRAFVNDTSNFRS